MEKLQEMKNRIGFTTQTFMEVLQRGEITLSTLFEWGAQQGFNWVEVRDFELNFTEVELQKIKTDTEKLGLRVHYAWDTTSVYKIADQDRIFQGIRNAELFGNGTCSRIVIAPELIHAAEGGIGYSAEEFQVLTAHIREYCRYAAERGVFLVFENSKEPIAGFEDLLEACPEMRMTFDTANTFNQEEIGVPLSWTQLKHFTLRRTGQIPYVHLKSFKNGQTQSDLIADGEVPLAELIPLLKPDAWLCVELPTDESLSSCTERLRKGLALLKRLV